MKIYRAFLLLILVIQAGACERNDLWSRFDGTETDSPSAIAATVTPPSGAWIARAGSVNNTITVLFDASMDTASLSLAGTLGTTATTAWTTTTLTDDTLTILPSSTLPGEGRTLTITCNSLEGESITLNRTYSIAQSVYYVNVANTTGPWNGTRNEPMNDIQTAVNAGAATGTPGVVLVAQGTFAAAATLITMTDGISLYGSYAPDWNTRDTAAYATILEDQRTSLPATTPVLNSARIIEIPAGITNATVIDGFTLHVAPIFTGASMLSACAIFINNASPVINNIFINSPAVSGGNNCNTIGICHVNGGSPTITNNSITLGTRTVSSNTGCNNYGIYALNGDAVITDSVINAGSVTGTGTSCSAYGIYISGGSPDISDSTVQAGNGIAESIALRLNQSSAVIADNTISAGGGTISYGIFSAALNAPISAPHIDNNDIHGGTGDTAFGIQFTEYTEGIISRNSITAQSSLNSEGIDLKTGAVPAIYGNIIADLSGSDTRGLRVAGDRFDTQITVYNNIVDSRGGSAINMGVEITGESNVVLANNILKGGAAGTVNCALYLDNPSASTNYFVKLSSNHLYTDTGGYGIYETSYESRPTTVAHNNFFISGTFYREYTNNLISNPIDIDNIDSTGTAFDGNISDNIYGEIDTGNEYRYTGDYTNAFVDFDSKGLDGSGWGFTTDRDGVTRTGDWSIGPYEYD